MDEQIIETPIEPIEVQSDISIHDIIHSEEFETQLTSALHAISQSYHLRPGLDKNLKYKRTWYDRFKEENLFTTTFFITNIEHIIMKRSTLPSVIRNVIHSTCMPIIINVWKKHMNIPENQNVELYIDTNV